MKYRENGVEIQYRECQILRDTAKLVVPAEKDLKIQELVVKKMEWMKAIEDLLSDKQKKKYCELLLLIIPHMNETYFRGIAEYTLFLLNRGRGIDIMVPYITADKIAILPVNLHDSLIEKTDDE